MQAERRSDAQKGGKRDAPHDWRVWIKDLEARLDVAWERRIQEWRERVAKTEELDVEDILDEIDEDEIEDADELDAEDDPTVKAPKKSRKAKKSKKAKSTKAKGEGGIGTTELAEAAGTDARALRVLLRAEFPREEGGRYVWKSLNDPEAKAIIKRVRSGAVKDAQADKLSKLKKSKSKKTSAKSTKKSTKKSGKKLTKSERAKARRAKAKKEAAADDE